MKKFIYKNSVTGFTITELMIAMGLTTIVGVGIFQALMNNNALTKAFSDKMDVRIEAKLGDKLLVRDIRSAGASLNNIYAKDDNGNNFFDFDSNRASSFYKGQNKKSRTLTLQKGGNTTFYFLTFDDLRGKGLFADAITFFNVGASPANINAAATLTYQGINYNNYLTAKDSAGDEINNSALISTENLNKLILVDSSAYMPTSPQKPAVFIGKVVKTGSIYDLQKIPTASIPKSGTKEIWNYDIRTPVNTTVVPTNFEQFMYYLPPVGANGASVRLKPVRLFKYYLDCTTDPAECVLYRQDVLHGVSAQQIQVLRGFSKIVFSRDDIATPVFEVVSVK